MGIEDQDQRKNGVGRGEGRLAETADSEQAVMLHQRR
jgi:hypothetical protein